MDYAILRVKKAEETYKKYIAWLYRLVVEDHNDFDLILAPADSGTFTAETAKIFYHLINKMAPKIVILPIQRYANGLGTDVGPHYDNSPLIPELQKVMKELTSLSNVLFVDDEIGLAYTAKEAIRVALAAVPKQIISERVVYTILAENHGFEWRYNIPPVAIKYIAFANKKQGINGAIFEFIPESVLKQFQQVESTISKKKIASIFTTGFIKTIQNGKPTLSDKLVHTIRISHPEFDELKEQFISQVTLLTQQAIEEYSRGEIKLRE